MNTDLVLIFQSIQTIHELEEELSTWKGWFRFRDKREYKELKEKVRNKIESLKDDRWTVKYLRQLEQCIEAFYTIIEDYLGNEVYIRNYNPSEEKTSRVFLPMYFVDERNKDRVIVLDIVSDNITFRIMELSTGNSFSCSSSDEVQYGQKKIESVCKHCIITMLLRYLDKRK